MLIDKKWINVLKFGCLDYLDQLYVEEYSTGDEEAGRPEKQT